MRRKAALLLGAAAVAALLPSPAAGHIGVVVTRPVLLHPAGVNRVQAGDSYHYDYTPEDADQEFHVVWSDGDADPTGRISLYWLDHAVSAGVTAAQVEQLGTLVRDRDGRPAEGIYMSCSCGDAGVACDGGPRWCDNDFTWDTRALPAGAYWLVAVNDDPPFHVYGIAGGPVRVAHGGDPPPVVIVVRPDGFDVAREEYRVGFVALGSAPLTADLAYGQNILGRVLDPVTPIATGIPVTVGADGIASYSWDVSSVPSSVYFVRVTLRDAAGTSSFADSFFGLSIYHPRPLDALAEPDLGVAPPPATGGCACRAAGHGGVSWWMVAMMAGWWVRRRRN